MRRKAFRYPPGSGKSPRGSKKAAAAFAEPELTLINVRAAKDQLSSLLEQAAAGTEIVITSDGVPKAKLVPFRATRKPFRVNWALLRVGSVKPGIKTADEVVREDRDGRA